LNRFKQDWAELLQNGLPVKIETKPGAVIYTYEKASE
jgi:hypothetical protein